MAISPNVPAALGAIAFFPTTAIFGIHIILARSPQDRAPSVRAAAIAATIFQGALFVSLPFLSLSHVVPWAPSTRWKVARRIWFTSGLGLCAVASVVSVASIVCLSQVVNDPRSTILGLGAQDFLVGSSVALGLAFATQLAFFVFHFLAGRSLKSRSDAARLSEHVNSRLGPRIKTVPYHNTAPALASKERGSRSFDSQTPPGSSAGRSTAETVNSTFSQAIRPITSKTRLLSTTSRRSSHRPASLDTLGSQRERQSRFSEVGFDSWDTSAVDPENRQTVLESSSPKPTRFLETIPASPTTSRSPSPGNTSEILEPPQARRRSRSYSPVSTRTIHAQRAAFPALPSPPITTTPSTPTASTPGTTAAADESEAHIHPLFRSGSPAPPSATPGTVVVAAPNAGQVISTSDKHSIRSIQSLRRLRSESQPQVPSPLSRANSCESFLQAGGASGRGRSRSGSPELREEEEEDEGEEQGKEKTEGKEEDEEERMMTPPIPDYVLNAGLESGLRG
ncbi:hypothetical protein B0J18DRAFT_182546 [Chaetomium sp. MPI-SDFR-AT-0129]|nr:hypothetical protein B0J18DRAFT_182546 [Chaetomium sp. MPI-SDFR-AT-0129]